LAAVKRLHGSASALAAASIEECFALLVAVEAYPQWHPHAVRSVEVLARDEDGRASEARTTLHVSRGPIARDFSLVVAVAAVQSQSVTLTRLPDEPADREQFEVRWLLEPEAAATRIGVDLEGFLAVPRLLPLAGIGEATASAFVTAAAAAVSGG
jgi:hypothetical protein